ncbi:hypothetical protein B0H10DRAFT_2009226 [Mycena sp. CBHHK59/15]|nr:hypothetical protein B0H10DRAFT_2009226 [Mycena sp. CBHHK59/15]
MRFALFFIPLFTLLVTLAAATSIHDETKSNVAASIFRPWTWPLGLPALSPGLETSISESAMHVRRHGPRRRSAAHP